MGSRLTAGRLAAIVVLAAATMVRAGNSAEIVRSTIPATMSPGYSYDVSVTVLNTGTTTWTPDAAYKLGEVGDSALMAPGRVELDKNDVIIPGQEKTFSFAITAPIAAGTYTITFRMVQELIEWFGGQFAPDVLVTFGPDRPPAPTITWPSAGMILGSNRPDITWATVPIDAYEVHIGSANTPSSADGWDSGPVYLSGLTNAAMAGPLAAERTYYVFVRHHNSNGWGSWSAAGHAFHVAGELINDPYFIAGPSGGQWQHTMCHNPDRNEYLIAYMDARPGTRSVISYWRLDSTGARIGGERSIPDDLAGTGGPRACYNSARQEYLIAYGGYTERQGLHDELRLQRVDAATGDLIGGSRWVANTPGAFGMNVAYSPASDAYLLVWDSGYDRPCPLYATRLSSEAVPVGGIFHASTSPYVWAGNASICHNAVDDEFFITFQAYYETEPQTWWDYYAQRVRASDGALLGSNITIAATPDYDSNGDVAHDRDANRYLVVYDGASPSPWGQFVSASGTLQGARFSIAPGTDYHGGMVGVAWHPLVKEYLVTWAHCCSYGNFARRLSAGGAYIGEPFRTNGSLLGIGNWDPMPVANPASGEFLLYWFCSYDDVYVRRYKPHPLPPPDAQPPAPVAGLTLTRTPAAMELSWTNPATPDFSATMIRVKAGSPPTGPTDGTLVVDQGNAPGTTDHFTDTSLSRGAVYCYAAFAHDFAPNHAAAATACGILVGGDFDGDEDVDQADFGHLQACLAGDQKTPPPGCDDADLDGDGDADGADFARFANCAGGTNQPPGC